jgi:hypothetical protein
MQPLLIPSYHDIAGSNQKVLKINADLSSDCFNLQLDTLNHPFRDAGSSSPAFQSSS